MALPFEVDNAFCGRGFTIGHTAGTHNAQRPLEKSFNINKKAAI
ncbi:hypothetical protein SAMN04489858_1037 [Paracoccus homiensis]|uniref:Uncharacterized protein n=1 Tax=Paracoccus homiensis TaxID=364199 RepID=A0A1I0BQG1_9RHOB|nr:hypothetical protein SAMN04489858_1037 [Paracoccus homiensis]